MFNFINRYLENLCNNLQPQHLVGFVLFFFAAGNLIHHFHKLETWIMVIFLVAGLCFTCTYKVPRGLRFIFIKKPASWMIEELPTTNKKG
jgi:hypothetical protein